MLSIIPFVDLKAQYLSLKDEIDKAIFSVIDSSSFLRGEHVDNFESNFAQKLSVNNCISCGNGTDALYIAMKALGVGPGDEVITTAHSWISSSETITQAGARVVFCDTNEHDFLLNVDKVSELITPKTKGILPVHLYGQAVDMNPLMEIARAHNLWVLEDCAQAHFATYHGKVVGTFGDAATFSFYPGKNLGAMGDAGCIVTNRNDIAEFSKLFSSHGGKGEHKIEGINSRMDGLQAAILNVKLDYIDNWNQKRRNAALRYDKLLASLEQVSTPIVNDTNEHVFHLYVIKCKFRDKLRKFLSQHGISTSLNYPKALPYYQAYDYLGHTPEDFPCAYKNQNEILSLPIFPEISFEQQSFVFDSIHEFYRKS